METTQNPRPLILTDDATVGELDCFESTLVKASNLKPGMILMAADGADPFACAIIDHRMRADRNSGCVKFFVANVESGHGRYSEVNLHANGMIRVAAR